jgi:hypothetical protein
LVFLGLGQGQARTETRRERQAMAKEKRKPREEEDNVRDSDFPHAASPVHIGMSESAGEPRDVHILSRWARVNGGRFGRWVFTPYILCT